MLIGYARVSTQDQYLGMQEDVLKNAGCEDVFTDVASGAKTACPGLHRTLLHLRKVTCLSYGDWIVWVGYWHISFKP